MGGFRKLLNYVHEHYGQPEIIVTEGGWAAQAHTDAEAVHDVDRTFYYANYTSEMLKAITEDGVQVTGYYAWSYVDNLEWEDGMTEKFGLLYNDITYGNDPNAPVNQTHQPTR